MSEEIKNCDLPFLINIAQLKLLGDFEDDGPDLSEVTVTTEIVPKDVIGEKKPQVIGIILNHMYSNISV